jgi:transcriptional regulator with XRE-family HTH domain
MNNSQLIELFENSQKVGYDLVINIAQRLKDLRKQYAFSQANVADGIGMKRSSYQAYEEGRATPSLETYIRLCALYGFNTIDVLMGISEPKKQNLLLEAYYRTDPEKRKIVDFVLGL